MSCPTPRVAAILLQPLIDNDNDEAGCQVHQERRHPEAKIGENVEIAPFVFIDKNVVIGDNNKIMANANILYGSRIGNGNTIFPGAVIGAIPQDLKFQGEESTAEIGDNNTIRENVTIKDRKSTRLNSSHDRQSRMPSSA